MKQAKVVIIGSSGVGKSSLAIRFSQDKFNDHLESTLGAAYFEKVHHYNGSKSLKFQFWDTAGQQKYKAIAKIYYKDCKVAIAVYDVTKKNSFISLQQWIQQLKNAGPERYILAIVGNKIDLLQQHSVDEVPYQEARQFADKNGAIFKLTSAKDNKGINQLFNCIAQRLDSSQQNSKIFENTKGSKILEKSKIKSKEKKESKCC